MHISQKPNSSAWFSNCNICKRPSQHKEKKPINFFVKNINQLKLLKTTNYMAVTSLCLVGTNYYNDSPVIVTLATVSKVGFIFFELLFWCVDGHNVNVGINTPYQFHPGIIRFQRSCGSPLDYSPSVKSLLPCTNFHKLYVDYLHTTFKVVFFATALLVTIEDPTQFFYEAALLTWLVEPVIRTIQKLSLK